MCARPDQPRPKFFTSCFLATTYNPPVAPCNRLAKDFSVWILSLGYLEADTVCAGAVGSGVWFFFERM